MSQNCWYDEQAVSSWLTTQHYPDTDHYQQKYQQRSGVGGTTQNRTNKEKQKLGVCIWGGGGGGGGGQ